MMTMKIKGSFTYLHILIHADVVAMDTLVNNWKSLIGQSSLFENDSTSDVGFAANVLKFAEYCVFHACRKRERKSDYQRRYCLSLSRNIFFR